MEMANGESNGHVTDYVTISHDPKRSNSTPIHLERYLENTWSCYLAIIANYYSLLCGGMVSYPSDSLASCVNVDLTGRLAFVVILTLVV